VKKEKEAGELEAAEKIRKLQEQLEASLRREEEFQQQLASQANPQAKDSNLC
jgi:hypothetical protein